MNKQVKGFSKLSKEEKINWVASHYFQHTEEAKNLVKQYWNTDPDLQKIHDEFIENTLTNFYLPLGVAPNFIINDKSYVMPMAIEESSVVAAAAKAAKYWGQRGGFKAEVLGEEKIGQVHFIFKGDAARLQTFIHKITPKLKADTAAITKNMEARGGGIRAIALRDKSDELENYYQLHVSFLTVDSMGANFINSCLEQMAQSLQIAAREEDSFAPAEKEIEIVMSILSNYVPNCLVRASVDCPIKDLEAEDEMDQNAFAEKLVRAVQIAEVEPHRAVTHNKGIMNGIDAVVLATGNDFRAVEAGIHAYAAKSGQYRSLSAAKIENGHFYFSLDIPLAVGTVGGLTQLHPLVKWSLTLLGNPSAKELMQIIAVAGLAQNFAALRSLVTSGIQKGHMKMHLLNILNQQGATPAQKEAAVVHFKTNTVSFSAVADFLKTTV